MVEIVLSHEVNEIHLQLSYGTLRFVVVFCCVATKGDGVFSA